MGKLGDVIYQSGNARGSSPVTGGVPCWSWCRALWRRSHSGRSCVSRKWRRDGLWVLLRNPGWGTRAVVGLRRRVDNLLLARLVLRPSGCRCRHTGGTDVRVVDRGAEYPLAHIRRVTQNRTGGYLTGRTSSSTPVLRQVEGDGGRGLIVIGGGKEFLFLYGHELALDLALRASLASLASGLGRGALWKTTIRGQRGPRVFRPSSIEGSSL